VCILDDTRIAINNLLILAEDIVVCEQFDHLQPPGFIHIGAVPDHKRDPNCPIKYKVFPSDALLQRVAKVEAAKHRSDEVSC
jgi:hypothetical protein